jgi:hypothetical protein
MTKKLSFDRTNRRGFLRTGIVGGAGLVVAQFAAPKKLFAQTNSWSSQVIQSSDDAEMFDVNGIMNLTSPTVNVQLNGYESGFRYQNVPVPNSATITQASVTFFTPSTPAIGSCPVYLQAADNPPTFTTAHFDLRRPHTVNFAAYVANGVGWATSADLSAAVQEVVNRPGWAPGNAMVLLCIPDIDDSFDNVATYDYEPGPPPNYSPIFSIEWT